LGVGHTVHRDTWQDYYDKVIAQMGMGTGVVPLDGLTEPNYQPSFPPPFALTVNTGKKVTQYSAGDKLALTLKCDHDIYVEVIYTDNLGGKQIWVPSTTKIKSGEEYRYPPKGESLEVKDKPGKHQVTVYASTAAFPKGEILKATNVADRVAHPFHMYQKGKSYELTYSPDPAKTIKKTIELEVK
jgi:hypothetical protein